MPADAAFAVPPNFPITGYAARRLVEIKQQMIKDLGRQVTYTEVAERLLAVYESEVPG